MRPVWPGAVRWSTAGAALNPPDARPVLRRDSVAVRLAKDTSGPAPAGPVAPAPAPAAVAPGARSCGTVTPGLRPETPRVTAGTAPENHVVRWPTAPSHPQFQGVSGVSPRIQQAPAPTLSHPEPTAPVPTQMAPPYPAACRPRPRLSSTNSAENLGQNVQWSRPPADVHSRLLYLEHSFMELRSDMERRSQELSTQVESLAQTLHRLDGQMLHGKTNGEAACSCPQLKKIVSLTLLELEKLTRRANDAFDRSACSSIKQIQELQHLTESIDRGQAEAAQAEEGSDCRSEATCSPHRRVGELSPATVQGSPWRGSSAATCPPGAEVELEEAMRLS